MAAVLGLLVIGAAAVPAGHRSVGLTVNATADAG
jgi:hypothetical protein